jgi:hypothetical protein
MKDGKDSFNVLESVEKHIQALKPLLPKQAIVCIGEYPIKILLKGPGITKDPSPLPILIEKSTEEVEMWMPKGFRAHYVLGFEDQKIESHFWYNALPFIVNDETVVASLKKKSIERLHGALIIASVWDGIGSASLPTLIARFKSLNQDSLAIAILPSKVQPADAKFNTYASLKMCQSIDGATVLLIDRDRLEGYEGVNRQGELIKGNMVVNYLVNLFLTKDTLVDEVSELSRTFGAKLFTPLLVTGASWKIYGSLENILNTSLLKPFLTINMASASVLYVLLRMPKSLKDKLPRSKIELAIANWFENKADLESIYIAEPVYTEDMTDRIDVILLLGGFDTTQMFGDLQKKVVALKNQAVEKGMMTEDWQIIPKIEFKPEILEEPAVEPPQIIEEPQQEKKTDPVENTKTTDITPSVTETETLQLQTITENPIAEEPKVNEMQNAESPLIIGTTDSAVETKSSETTPAVNNEKDEGPKNASEPKRARRTKKATSKEN